LSIHDFNISEKQIFLSSLLLILCCVFYLAWWVLAFKPVGAIKGIKTGWLLIPASIAGVAAVILAVNGILSGTFGSAFFSSRLPIWGGIAVYLILLPVTGLLLKRPVTSELFLIVGLAVLELSEINVLYGTGRFSHGLAIIFVVVIGVTMLLNLVCYVLYYNLGAYAGYFDGMIPLFVAALTMAGISTAMVV
jgi:hypothetical protein